ncbi:MAG: outer membrane protein heavy metal efflux system [Acidobacteriota bacterium]|jgi:cobalt-zinc-cadmium efflux system outer membrane protein|nr:outer membrane protein heavy metal efflux system [Acidobacteriota bacterium]
MRQAAAASLAAVLLFPGLCLSQSTQPESLTISDALRLARERAATILEAGGRVEEARARLLPAALRWRENPVLEVGGGRRHDVGSFFDYEVSVSQAFEPEIRRRARIAGAEAALAAAEAELGEVRRIYLSEVAAAFQRALAAQERLLLTAEASRLSGELLATIERRYGMGEITALELNRARTAAARARAELRAAEGEGIGASGELRALLGLPAVGELPLAGGLRELPRFELEPLLARTGERPDLAALAAGAREAEAQVRLGETLARPEWALRTGFAREERADIVSGGIAITLPLFRRGQEEQAVGRARADSLRAREAAVRRAAEAEVRGAFAAYQRRLQAVTELESAALPAVADNETLAQRSFEAGEINLGELLLIRREILETRLSHLDLLLAARLAAVELETKAGGMR